MRRVTPLPSTMNKHSSSSSNGGAKPVNEMSKTKKIITAIYIGVMMGFTIGLIGKNASVKASLKQTSDYIKEVMQNWEKGIITDIKVASTCPTGYEAVTYKWPGTVAGCYCPTSKNGIAAGLSAHSCWQNQTAIGCQEVPAIPSFEISNVIMDALGTGKKLCYKREPSVTFLNSARLSPWHCQTGYRPCGNIHNFEKRLCVPSDIECPVNSIKTEIVSTSTGNLCDGQFSNCIAIDYRLGDTQVIIWEDNADSYAIAEFDFQEYGPCDLYSKDNMTPGRIEYPLIAKSKSSCTPPNKKYAQEFGFQEVYSISEYDLFAANNKLTEVQSLPQYYDTNQLKNFQWKLMARTYMPWANGTCREYVEQFHSRSKDFRKLAGYQTANLVISIISGIFVGLMIPAMELANLLGYDLPCFPGKGAEELRRVRRFKRGINYFFKGILIPCYIVTLAASVKQADFFMLISDLNCTVGQAEVEIDNASKAIGQAKSGNAVSLVLAILMILFDIAIQIKDKMDDKKAPNIPAIKTDFKGSRVNIPKKEIALTDDSKDFLNNNSMNTSVYTDSSFTTEVTKKKFNRPMKNNQQNILPSDITTSQFVPQNQQLPQQHPQQFAPQFPGPLPQQGQTITIQIVGQNH